MNKILFKFLNKKYYMVDRRFSFFDLDRIFRIIEEQMRRSLENARRIFEDYEIEEYPGFKTPLADIVDEGDRYIIEVEIPGVKKEDIEVYTYDNKLEIIAKRKLERREEREGYIKIEIGYSGFRRSFTLHEDADMDKIKAKYENGVLRIEIPKKEGFARRRINIE
jgi:HSP20 family protein